MIRSSVCNEKLSGNHRPEEFVPKTKSALSQEEYKTFVHLLQQFRDECQTENSRPRVVIDMLAQFIGIFCRNSAHDMLYNFATFVPRQYISAYDKICLQLVPEWKSIVQNTPMPIPPKTSSSGKNIKIPTNSRKFKESQTSIASPVKPIGGTSSFGTQFESTSSSSPRYSFKNKESVSRKIITDSMIDSVSSSSIEIPERRSNQQICTVHPAEIPRFSNTQSYTMSKTPRNFDLGRQSYSNSSTLYFVDPSHTFKGKQNGPSYSFGHTCGGRDRYLPLMAQEKNNALVAAKENCEALTYATIGTYRQKKLLSSFESSFESTQPKLPSCQFSYVSRSRTNVLDAESTNIHNRKGQSVLTKKYR